MKKTDKLRERAEEELQKSDKDSYISVNESELVHELQVHQTELEIQNEELRDSQSELSKLYNQYHELYNEAPVGYFSLNKDGIIRNVNIKGAEILGLGKEEIIGFGFSKFIPKDFQNKYYHSLANAVDTGKTQEIELQLSDKPIFCVQMRIMPIYHKHNEQFPGYDEKYRIIMEDITERKKAEEVLQKSEANYRNFFNNPLMGFALCEIITDENGEPVDFIYLQVNRAFEKFTGLKKEEVKSKKVTEVLEPEEVAGVIKIYGKVALTGESANFEYPIPSLNKCYEIAAFSPRKGRFIAFFTDVTPRKQIEAELRQAHSNLEDKVEERTVELEESYQNLKENELQLKGMVKELKRSNEELQRFTYITSHDLQEPLRTIASFTQLLEMRYKGKFDSDADEFMNYVVDASIRMKDMIQGLLEYSRIGTQGNEFMDFNAEDALKEALNNLKLSSTECDAEITHDDLPVIHANKSQITRVFQNLISNALKFRKEVFPPRIHISAQRKNNEWIFSVEDNGIGMEKQYTNKIFEVFRRLHTIDEYKGTGIGLAIFERIISNHGGRVWVESEFGVGSTFYFTIPINEENSLNSD